MNLTADAIAAAYLDLADCDMDWVRIARIRDLVSDPADQVTAALVDLMKTGLVHLAPESNTKVLTSADHAAAVHQGSEDLHLIAFDPDYFQD